MLEDIKRRKQQYKQDVEHQKNKQAASPVEWVGGAKDGDSYLNKKEEEKVNPLELPRIPPRYKPVDSQRQFDIHQHQHKGGPIDNKKSPRLPPAAGAGSAQPKANEKKETKEYNDYI